MESSIPSAPVESIETRSDLGKDDAGIWRYWMGQEAIAEKAERTWIDKADKIVQRYRDERPDPTASVSKFNVLWSNVETLKPTLYGRTPKADVDRRFKDNATPTARYAAILMQRCLQFICDTGNFDDVMKPVVEDKLLPGRGVARVLYVPHFGEPIKEDKPALGSDETEQDEKDASDDGDDDDAVVDSEGDEKQKSEPLREVTYEEGQFKYVFWKDYREGPARQWCEVPWIRYRSYLTRDELTKRFGKKKAVLINLDFTPEGHVESSKNELPPDLFKKAMVFEFWDKTNREVIWLAPGTPDLKLDKQPDPLGLPEFFPSPNPLLATTTTDKRIPVPDYIQYQDQARELDRLTARIDRLTRALKVAGVYPGEEKQVLSQLIDEGTENILIPVGDWTNWSEKGGLEGFIQYVPIKQIAETLIQLYDARDRVKAILYELTGIGDIMRGMTSPDETLGAQELKAVFATRRITPQQKRVAAFARDLLRLMGGIIAAHFSDKTITAITGFPQLAPVPPMPPRPQMPPEMLMPAPPPPQGPLPGLNGGAQAPLSQQLPQPSPAVQAYQQAMQQWQQAVQQIQALQKANDQKQQEFAAACTLIREDGVHGFKIDVEADSTIAPDEQAEKAARTEFMRQFVPLMEQLVPIAQGNPPLAALAKEIALFGVRGFPVARSLEETIEQAFDAIAKMPPVPPKGTAGKQAGPSPQDIALRGKEIDSRERIARQANAVKMADIQQDAIGEREKLEADQERDRTELALKMSRGAKQDALAGARLTHIEARDAGMLS